MFLGIAHSLNYCLKTGVHYRPLYSKGIEYAELLNATSAKELGENKIKVSELPNGDRIVGRVARHLKSRGIKFRPKDYLSFF